MPLDGLNAVIYDAMVRAANALGRDGRDEEKLIERYEQESDSKFVLRQNRNDGFFLMIMSTRSLL